MATQTPTQRQAAAQRAAATRKRNQTKRSAAATKSAARRTRSSATQAGRQARGTTRQASRTATRGLGAATTRLGAVGRSAQRALLIQVGAAATVGDKVRQTARTYTSLDLVQRELNRFERRGDKAISRRQRTLNRQRRDVADRVKHLV